MNRFRLPRRALIALALGACWPLAHAVDGSGRLVGETRPLTGYKTISIEAPVQVVLRQSGREGVELRGDDNLLPLLDTHVKGQMLFVGPRDDAQIGRNQVVVTIDLIALHALTLAGSGSVKADALIAPRLDVAQGGSGRITLHGLDAGALHIALGGSGVFEGAGKANRCVLHVGGSGNVLADPLQCGQASVNIGGSGNVELHAQRSLNVSIAGSGNVRYSGDPQLKTAIAGSGRVGKR